MMAATQRINKVIQEITGLCQWISTQQVLPWFNDLQNKDELNFFWMDIESFYPSITYRLLKKAIQWDRQYTTIRVDDEKLLIHCWRTFAFYEGKSGKPRV